MTTFGTTIRGIRERAMKSMSDVAKAIGVSVVYYSDIERGRRNPPLGEKLYKIADFFGIDKKEMESWAYRDRERVELDLKAKDGPVAEAALLLAKRWDDITDHEANNILKILNKGQFNEQKRTRSNGASPKKEGYC